MTPVSSTPAIILEHVGKRYDLFKHKAFLMREVFSRFLRKADAPESFWALQDVNLSIDHGESVAIVGSNGAGKSTLLGLVAGTIRATLGTVGVAGRASALLELGAGFHPDLTGRENIYLNASLLGLRRPEIDARFEQIVAFSGLAEFIDVPLRTYSSGMKLRLGFSVASHTDAEILLMDEVFAVGDQDFQRKCLALIAGFKSERRTMLFVGHGIDNLRTICDRAVWLEHGRVMADGPLADVFNLRAAAAADREKEQADRLRSA
jgi:ABC-2 type transport system ATP-binding protein